MTGGDLYLVAYDVTKRRERERVAAVLEGFGCRLQKSVFECRLTRSGRERLLARLGELGLSSGFALVVRLDARAKPHRVGRVPEAFPEERDFSFFLTNSPGPAEEG